MSITVRLKQDSVDLGQSILPISGWQRPPGASASAVACAIFLPGVTIFAETNVDFMENSYGICLKRVGVRL